MIKRINTESAPGAIGPYSQAVETDSMIYTSGQLGIDPATGELKDGIEAQTTQSFENLKAILTAAGADFSNVIKVLVFLKDMNDFAKMNDVYSTYITGDVLPARSTVQVAKLPKDGLVEIEVVALKK